MTATASTHKTNFQSFKWYGTSIFNFVKSADKNISRQFITTITLTFPNVFYSFLFPTALFGFDKPVLAIQNLAHLPLLSVDADTLVKSKKPNLPTHFFGFFKPSFAVTNLTQFVFTRDMQKQNQLNFLTHKIGVLHTSFACTLTAPKCIPQAYGILFLSATKCCLTSFYKKTFGFP